MSAGWRRFNFIIQTKPGLSLNNRNIMEHKASNSLNFLQREHKNKIVPKTLDHCYWLCGIM